MREVIDEALQTLYWACREGRGFPGTVPDESSGQVSTDAILRGLGLTPPVVERIGAGSSASKRVADESDGAPERSYHPPDIPSDYRSMNENSVRQMQPSDRPDNPAVDGGIGQQEYKPLNARERVAPNHDLVPDSLDPRFRVLLDGDFDPDIFHHDNDGTMDLGHVESADVSNLDLHSRTQWSQRYGYRSRESNNEYQESMVRRDNSRKGRENANWESDAVPKSSETLPWPGTLAAVSRDKKGGTRSGFQPPPNQ
ncbi:hypothetical protein LTR84_010396 [Exophiala bonariae]|uniref:Uncharacterized protein n=1 Tax=Exophiala bonariae TaxID=1690606 RepID=A0AAV9MTM0_9EURO|nr:hypothetical protein LTR84_010396 [Exophiala bonariae]